MLTSTVSRCHTRGESEDHAGEKTCKGSTLALKPGVYVIRSPKQRCQWPTKRTCPPKMVKYIKKTQKTSHGSPLHSAGKLSCSQKKSYKTL